MISKSESCSKKPPTHDLQGSPRHIMTEGWRRLPNVWAGLGRVVNAFGLEGNNLIQTKQGFHANTWWSLGLEQTNCLANMLGLLLKTKDINIYIYITNWNPLEKIPGEGSAPDFRDLNLFWVSKFVSKLKTHTKPLHSKMTGLTLRIHKICPSPGPL